MKKLLLVSATLLTAALHAQLNIDTLAFQDFEIAPAAPVWSFTGPVIYNSGFSSASAAPANSPLGIGGSRAWETTTNSGGLVLNFANTVIPAGYDSIRVRFNLAAMNLLGSGGGPDNLDYVLVAYSIDGGFTYVNRVRIRGAVNDNSTWPYSATGVARPYYLPASEALYQPVSTGPQTTLGYSTVEVAFPGGVTNIAFRITARSSSSTDTWLVDNVVLLGENFCASTTSSITSTTCGPYTAPSGAVFPVSGVYQDIIANVAGCDSVITLNLTINSASTASINPAVCGNYTSPSGNVYAMSGTYMDTIANVSGCDSVITINLTVNNASLSSMNAVTCGNYTSPSGNVYTTSGTYMDTIPNAAGCDSVITIGLTVNSPTASSNLVFSCFSYTSPEGNVYTASGTYLDTIPNVAGCDSVITLDLTIGTVDVTTTLSGATLQSNASGATYQWIDCANGNAIIPGETNQAFSPSVNGNYAVIVIQAPCVDTSACVIVLSVGINASAQNEISVAPNPTNGNFTVTQNNAFASATVTVFDVQGKIVAQQSNVSGSNITIDIADQPAGVYFLEIAQDGQVMRTKVVKL
ncbi:MAG TPA: T9SS type A sorting domain-containing protein [Bacteroidia bacterium]|nr:T9SS type A sorting domain-containing protein [Bacteroidia bacterium]